MIVPGVQGFKFSPSALLRVLHSLHPCPTQSKCMGILASIRVHLSPSLKQSVVQLGSGRVPVRPAAPARLGSDPSLLWALFPDPSQPGRY
jgi:hypothetical protein